MQFDEVDDIPGTAVWSMDGRSLGRVSVVHVPTGSDQPLLVQLPAGAERQHVVPLARAELRAEGLVLGYDAATIEAAPVVDSVIALSVGEAAYVLEHFGLRLAHSTGLSLTERMTRMGDVGSIHPGVRGLPPLRTVPDPADPGLPPIVVIKPGVADDIPRS